jgi:acyl carrier protein
MKKNLEKELKKIISKLFKCSEKKINFNSGPITNDIEKWDSFGNLELILEVEKKMKIKFSSIQINKINSFKKLLNEVVKAHGNKT